MEAHVRGALRPTSRARTGRCSATSTGSPATPRGSCRRTSTGYARSASTTAPSSRSPPSPLGSTTSTASPTRWASTGTEPGSRARQRAPTPSCESMEPGSRDSVGEGAREHRPAYGSDGDHVSKPPREEIVRAVCRLIREADRMRYLPWISESRRSPGAFRRAGDDRFAQESHRWPLQGSFLRCARFSSWREVPSPGPRVALTRARETTETGSAAIKRRPWQ